MQELLRAVKAALTDGTYGVNAQLATLPLSSGHAAPTNIAQVLTQDDDITIAFGDKSETFPALVVLDEDAGEWDAEIATRSRDGDVGVTILYVLRDPRAALAYRNSSYTRRAVLKCLRDWLDNSSHAARTENSVFAISATGLRRRPSTELIRGIPHAGGLTMTFRVRDLAP